MDSTTWKRAKQVFYEALERSGPERNGFVASACGEDQQLRAQVQALLSAHDEAGEFLASPTVPEPDEIARAAATLSSSTPTERPGTTIGPYKLLQVIGTGGFGVVYMAEQEEPVRRRVALKIIKLGMDTKQVIARFEAERQALALMEHPNIARVLDVGATDTGRPFFVMELVKGVPITEYCDSDRLTTHERLDLFRDVCAAVQHAHQKGVIHRDIKPSNVLVTLHDGKPVPKVIDFGIAKATHLRLTEKTLFTEYGQFIGTPAYMSPEQAEMSGRDIDTRSDIYSLGVLLYELLTGTTPFDIDALRRVGYGEIQRMIREEEPPKPSTRLSTLGGALTDVAKHRKIDPGGLSRLLRGELDWIVMRALEKERKRRYNSPLDLADDVRRHLTHEPVLAGPPGVGYRARKFIRRHWVGVGAATAVVSALVVGLSAATFGLFEARRANAQARLEASRAEQVSEFLTSMFEVSDPDESRGSTITAREILERGVEKIETELATQPEAQARLMITIGRVYRSLDQYDAARSLMERGASILKVTLGDEHPETLRALSDLSTMYAGTHREEEVEALIVETLETQRRVLGEDDPDTLVSMRTLAVLRMIQGRFAESETLLNAVLEGRDRALGEAHPDTLEARSLRAAIYSRQGRYVEAEKEHAALLDVRRRVLGSDHPDTLRSIFNLASLHQERGRFGDAEALLVEGRRRAAAEDHPHKQLFLRGLADLYEVTGRPQDARPLVAESLDLRRRAAEAPGASPSAKNMFAWRLLTCGVADFRDPRTALRFALEANEMTGDSDADYLDTLALAYHLTGQTEKAVDTARKALSNVSEWDQPQRSEFEGRLAEYEAALADKR